MAHLNRGVNVGCAFWRVFAGRLRRRRRPSGAMIRRMANCVVVSAAIRFDKLAVRYLATVRIATLAEWLR